MFGLDLAGPRTRTWRRTMGRLGGVLGLALAMTALTAGEAHAHCDTMDGPVVGAAGRALASGSLAPVLIWIRPEDEAEVAAAFRHARTVRSLGAEARSLADRYFFETVVRVHREGEGESFTGLKPAGTDLGPVVPAADRALETGDVAELEALVLHAVRDGLRERFARAVAAKGFAPGDVAAGRAYVAAYVPLLHYVEEVHALSARAAGAHGPAAPPTAAHESHAEPRPGSADGAAGGEPHQPPRPSPVSPVQRPVSGPALTFSVEQELRAVHEQLATTSRTARTLVKNGSLRVTLMGLAVGGAIAPHSADGPMVIQVVEGVIEVEAGGTTRSLAAGTLLALDAGIVHGVRSPGGGVFLLTVAARAE